MKVGYSAVLLVAWKEDHLVGQMEIQMVDHLAEWTVARLDRLTVVQTVERRVSMMALLSADQMVVLKVVQLEVQLDNLWVDRMVGPMVPMSADVKVVPTVDL